MNCKRLSMPFWMLVLAFGPSVHAPAARSQGGAIHLVRTTTGSAAAFGMPRRGSGLFQAAPAMDTASLKPGGNQSATSLPAVEREDERRAKIAATVEGGVVDMNTGKPIANAIVEWSFAGEKHTGFTDANGQFKLLVARALRSGRGGNLAISASGELSLKTVANLYQTQDTRIEIAPGKTIAVKIRLRPKPRNEIGEVRGTVTDKDDGRPFANVVVSILGAGQSMTTTTGGDGSFTIPGVGFSRNLMIQFKTLKAPCMATVVRPLDLAKRVVTVKLAIPVLKLPVLHCPG